MQVRVHIESESGKDENHGGDHEDRREPKVWGDVPEVDQGRGHYPGEDESFVPELSKPLDADNGLRYLHRYSLQVPPLGARVVGGVR